MTRTFKTEQATRANVPLLIALIGPSGGGKTFSAHRLARGIQRVQPGPIYGIDTEGKRMCELADRFEFKRLEFGAPYGSLDYLAAIQQCVKEGARTIIIDSMSHEHEGPGGMLDSAEQDVNERVERRMKSDANAQRWKLEQSYKLSGFIRPKADRQKLIQGILQLSCNIIMCFRSKEKIQPVPGGEPKHLGWMPIGGDEFWYEMTARCLLLPGANGVPAATANGDGEKLAMRVPEQFKSILRGQLSEDIGEKMARWASGDQPGDLADTLAQLEAASDVEALRRIAQASRGMQWTAEQKATIKKTLDARQSALKSGVVPGTSEENKDGNEK